MLESAFDITANNQTDAGPGSALTVQYDCNDRFAADVSFTTNPPGSLTLYFTNGVPSAVPEHTSLLRRVGLTEPELLDPSMRLSPDRSRELGRELLTRIGDPEAGLKAAERLRLSDIDLLGYVLRHSAHPLAALERFARYAQLLGDTLDGRVERQRGRVVVTFRLSDGRRMLPEAADYLVAGIFQCVRQLSNDQGRPIEVHIPRRRPRRLAAYRRFFGCPIVFDTEGGSLAYDARSLTVPFAGGDPRLVAILEVMAGEVLSTLPRRGTVIERVRAHIGRHMENGGCNLDAVAAEFRMSERTLRRRLQQAGGSYRAVLDQVRRERAVALVEQGEETLAAIAQRVGFEDTKAFARAFRRWTGVAPSAYRVR
jgi:AraC-like DNA-binding protein